MADSPKEAEAAQALFCAIVDLKGAPLPTNIPNYIVFKQKYIVVLKQKYCCFKTEILPFENRKQVSACQIWVKIMEFGPNQVHMAPFEVILKQNGSYRVWEASGRPPGP